MLLAALLLGASAEAQSAADFTDLSGPLMQPSELTWGLQTTIGSPTVFFDDSAGFDVLFMVFETQVGAPTSGCPAGTWGLGIAYSFDGLTWNDWFPLVEPDDAYYTCVAAHPTTVELAGGGSWVIYFKAEQDPALCPTGASWGCDRYAGIGRVAFSHLFGSVYGYSTPDAAPALATVAQDMGYPSVVFADGEYHMAFSQNPDLYVASSAFTDSFTMPTSPALVANSSATGWDADELYTPSLVCDGPSAFRLYTGGRDYAPFPTLIDQAVGFYTSSDLSTWTEGPAPLFMISDGDAEVKHMEMTTSDGFTEYGMYYTTPGAGGNELWLSSTAGFDWTQMDPKRCP